MINKLKNEIARATRGDQTLSFAIEPARTRTVQTYRGLVRVEFPEMLFVASYLKDIGPGLRMAILEDKTSNAVRDWLVRPLVLVNGGWIGVCFSGTALYEIRKNDRDPVEVYWMSLFEDGNLRMTIHNAKENIENKLKSVRIADWFALAGNLNIRRT